jgi:hypothetical protein
MLVFSGCSADVEKVDTSVVNQVIDNIADSIAKSIVESEFASSVEVESLNSEISELVAGENIEVNNFNDMVIVDSIVYAAFNGGLLAYDLSDDTYKAIDCGENLNAITFHNEEIYVGGNHLFKLVDANPEKVMFDDNILKIINPALETIPVHYDSSISSLSSYNGDLIIGTGQGLFSYSDNGYKSLRDDISVTALTADKDGLWIGTDGQGLYRLQDGGFHKRFLIRDSSTFDNVNCLDYNRGFVYVGTDDALYIFDGGRWETLTRDNGLLSNKVRSINADDWVIYIGTDRGIISYFNGDFMPVKSMENAIVNAFGRYANSLIIGTNDALKLKSRNGIRILVESEFIGPPEPAFVRDVINDATPDREELVGDDTNVVEVFEEDEVLATDVPTSDKNRKNPFDSALNTDIESGEFTGSSDPLEISDAAIEEVKQSEHKQSDESVESVAEGGEKESMKTPTE